MKLAFLLSAWLLAALPGAALACACCAEKGTWFDERMALGDYEREELAKLRAEGPAILFLTACGMECIQGIEDPKDNYAVEMSLSDDALTFLLGDHGDVRFSLPDSYEFFAVDTDPTKDGSAPKVYTEVRLDGTVTGRGDFEGEADAQLILSGPGNMCISARNLAHWRLSVIGEGLDYRLLGALTLR